MRFPRIERWRKRTLVGLSTLGISALALALGLSTFLAFSGSVSVADLNDVPGAVWQVRSEDDEVRGTAWAAELAASGRPDSILLVTAAHVIRDIARSNSPSILLQRWHDDEIFRLGEAHVLAISISYDLAILVSEKTVPRYLSVAENRSPGAGPSLRLFGYPWKTVQVSEQISEVIYSDELSDLMAMDRSGHAGFSGGPVVMPDAKVVGVMHSSAGNMVESVKLEHLQGLAAGQIGVACSERQSLQDCVEQATALAMENADGGNRVAQFQLYLSELPDGNWFEWLSRSARNGFPSAQYELGMHYKYREYSKARDWFTLGAGQGDPMSMLQLSYIYEKGRGVIKDAPLAFEWSLKSAESGYSEADHNTAWLLYDGIGTSKDRKAAACWIRRAANKGHWPSFETMREWKLPDTGVDLPCPN